jgi:hypothetical protein
MSPRYTPATSSREPGNLIHSPGYLRKSDLLIDGDDTLAVDKCKADQYHDDPCNYRVAVVIQERVLKPFRWS